MSKILFLSGLPRSGSTLLCNLLAQHPEIAAFPSSPLSHIVENMKKHWSDDPFLLSQLDSNFEEIHKKLADSTRAFMQTWCKSEKKFSIDKNRTWLAAIEFLRFLYPDFKMIVTLRDLRHVFASIEKQHKKTLMLDFPDHMSAHVVDARANSLFNDQGIIGSPLKFLNNIQDVPNILRHLMFVKFEDLMSNPKAVLHSLTDWIGVEAFQFNINDVNQITYESDSYYRMKFPHTVSKEMAIPDTIPISPRIATEIRNRFDWYYQTYYSEKSISAQDDTEKRIESEINQALRIE